MLHSKKNAQTFAFKNPASSKITYSPPSRQLFVVGDVLGEKVTMNRGELINRYIIRISRISCSEKAVNACCPGLMTSSIRFFFFC